MTNAVGENTVLVIGAGLMGTGIAHGFAIAGADVLLLDASSAAADKAVLEIGGILDGAVKIGKLDAETAGAAKSRITIVSDLAKASAKAGLVVETASENIATKIAIFEVVSSHATAGAILATNTSALSVTELAATTPRPEQFAGMHFFNPVHKMKLCEVVRGLATAPQTVDVLLGWATKMGKQSIVVNEAPGFTTSRMSALMGNEAMYMLQEGVATAEDIDTAMRLGFGHPMGPLELGDLTGWDTRFAVLQYLHRVLGEKFRPCPLIEKMVKAKRYGRKVGHGVYRYEDGKKSIRLGIVGKMSSSFDIVIVGAARTPVGRFRGALSQVRADHLGAVVLNALIERSGVKSKQIDDVIFGCVTQIGEQSANVARTALLSAGWPDSIPGMTIDRKCGSSEVATHIAAGFIAAGMAKIVVAGGVESMSRVPMGSNRAIHGEAFGWMVQERADLPSQGEAQNGYRIAGI